MAAPAWDAPADADKFVAASDWFAKRTVITGAEARKLDDDAKKHAFWVGGGLQITQIQRVFDELKKNADSGGTLEEFKKSIRDTLRNPHHVETVYRNAIQRQYNAGRYRQMREPFTLRLRPYWLLDTVLDARRSEICKICGGTILPADHPWWLTHIPPLHHRCRSSIRCLRAREAERRGISAAPPGEDGDAQKGFGHAPDDADEPPKPDPKKTDPALLRKLKEQEPEGVKKRKPVAPPPPAPKEPELDTKRWLPEYEPTYGSDAAKSLAHGRAALELGLDLPVAAIRKNLRKVDAPGVKAMTEACEDCDAGRTLREQAGELEPLRKAAAALAGHLHTLPARQAMANASIASTSKGEAALEFFSKVTGPSTGDLPASLTATAIRRRNGSYFDAVAAKIVYTARPGALHHEIAHAIEHYAPELFGRAVAFLKARRKGHALQSLGVNGLAWKDQFFHAYTGRRYPKKRDVPGLPIDEEAEVHSTETLSTSVELLFANETFWGTLEDWIRADSEHFLFMLGQLAGK